MNRTIQANCLQVRRTPLSVRESQILDSLPDDVSTFTALQSRRFNRIVFRDCMSLANKVRNEFALFKPMFMNPNGTRWISRWADSGGSGGVIVFSVVVGMLLSYLFGEFLFTRTPEEAAFLGQSVEIIGEEARMKASMICGFVFSFIIWHFASR